MPTMSNPIRYEFEPETYREWVINISLCKYSIGGCGTFSFFAGYDQGQLPTDPQNWVTSPNFIGSFCIFADDVFTTRCSNCKDQAADHFRIEGTVHLTDWLIKEEYPLYVNEDTVSMLANTLNWRIYSVTHDCEVPLKAVPGLMVLVQSAAYETVYELVNGRVREISTKREPWKIHTEVTEGKPGGVVNVSEFYLEE